MSSVPLSLRNKVSVHVGVFGGTAACWKQLVVRLPLAQSPNCIE